MKGRLGLIAAVLAGGALLLSSSAAANHRHVVTVGNGSCVILAVQGQEPLVTLPGSSFNNTTEPTTTTNPHPLHVHVHRGEPGQNLDIQVFESPADDCTAYLNGP